MSVSISSGHMRDTKSSRSKHVCEALFGIQNKYKSNHTPLSQALSRGQNDQQSRGSMFSDRVSLQYEPFCGRVGD